MYTCVIVLYIHLCDTSPTYICMCLHECVSYMYTHVCILQIYITHVCNIHTISTQYPHIYNMHAHTCTLSTHMYVNALLLLLLLSRSVVSNSVQPHRRQPTRLPCPWDSPGKNTGVGCHFLLQCIEVKTESEVAQSCLTLCDPMDCSLRGSSIHGIFQARVLEWGAIAFSDVYALPMLYTCVYISLHIYMHTICTCMYA